MSKPRIPAAESARGDYPAPESVRSGTLPLATAQGATWSHAKPEVWTDIEREALGEAFQEVLRSGMHGLCFSP